MVPGCLRQLGFVDKRWCLEGEVMVGDNCLKWLSQGEMVVVVGGSLASMTLYLPASSSKGSGSRD